MIGTPLQPTPEQVLALRERESAPFDADIFFVVCPACAFISWRSTHHEGSGKTHVHVDDHVCGPCAEFRDNHRAVFEWVLFVVQAQMSIREMAERYQEEKP